MPPLQRSDPAYYTDFVNLIRVGDFKTRIEFPIALTDITELEKINRTGSNPIPFRINVFREDPITGKIHLIRSSPLDDGTNINVLLIDFEYDEYKYSHYVLIDGMSFFRKGYINSCNFSADGK